MCSRLRSQLATNIRHNASSIRQPCAIQRPGEVAVALDCCLSAVMHIGCRWFEVNFPRGFLSGARLSVSYRLFIRSHKVSSVFSVLGAGSEGRVEEMNMRARESSTIYARYTPNAL